MILRHASIGGAALALAACAAVPPAGGGTTAPCPIVNSSDWAAWVNAMPGPDSNPTLIVTGKVTAPTGGYTFAWRDLRVMQSYPVQIVAELEPIPPDGPATQALDTHDLRGEWPVSPPVGSVRITCDGRELGYVSPVETAR